MRPDMPQGRPRPSADAAPVTLRPLHPAQRQPAHVDLLLQQFLREHDGKRQIVVIRRIGTIGAQDVLNAAGKGHRNLGSGTQELGWHTECVTGGQSEEGAPCAALEVWR